LSVNTYRGAIPPEAGEDHDLGDRNENVKKEESGAKDERADLERRRRAYKGILLFRACW
jgi:hypothetical protein